MKTTENSLYVENKVGEWIEYWQQKYLRERRNKMKDENGCSDCVEFWDNSPLTNEALISLGFKPLQESQSWWLKKEITKSITLITEGGKHQELYTVSISGNYYSPSYTTVGKLKMLIEALKGDE